MKKGIHYFNYSFLLSSSTALLFYFTPHNLSSNNVQNEKVMQVSTEDSLETKTSAIRFDNIPFRKFRIKKFMPKSTGYLDAIFEYSFQYGLEPEEVVALIQHESSWNPNAVSPKGALGMMQINPFFHKIKYPFDPYENIKYGISYLGTLKYKYKKPEIFYAAYNAGESEIDRWLSLNWNGNSKTIPIKETRDLVNRVTSTLHEINRL